VSDRDAGTGDVAGFESGLLDDPRREWIVGVRRNEKPWPDEELLGKLRVLS